MIECLLQLDLDVHASGELEAHQSLDRLVGRLQNVDQTLMSAALELLAAILVLVGSAQNGDDLTIGGQGMGPDTRAPVCFAVSTIFSAAASIS